MTSSSRDIPRHRNTIAWSALAAVSFAMVVVPIALLSCGSKSTGRVRVATAAPADPPRDGAASLPTFSVSTSATGTTFRVADWTPRSFAVSEVLSEPEIRVRIVSGSTSVVVEAADTLLFTATTASALALRGPVTVTREAGSWVLRHEAGGNRLQTDHPIEAASSSPISINGVRYPGRFRFVARSEITQEAFDVVELVALEAYLPGVVAKEMPVPWPMEALRAQAVAARTYAMHERTRRRLAGEAFDLESTERDQVYGGIAGHPMANEAVASTRGMVLAHEGKLLRAYFSSTCGGRGTSARNTWPTTRGFEFNLLPPLQATTRMHACEKSPVYRWEVSRDKDELVQRLRAYGQANRLLVRNLRDLNSITPFEFNEAGRPVRYRVIEPGGTWYELSAEELRWACNADAPGLPKIERPTLVRSGDMEFSFIAAAPRTGAARPVTVRIRGRGFGHGVGMCQFCARGFADRAETHAVMLHRFYPGASLIRAYP